MSSLIPIIDRSNLGMTVTSDQDSMILSLEVTTHESRVKVRAWPGPRFVTGPCTALGRNLRLRLWSRRGPASSDWRHRVAVSRSPATARRGQNLNPQHDRNRGYGRFGSVAPTKRLLAVSLKSSSNWSTVLA